MALPDLEVIIVSHGAKDLLRRCLLSLERNPYSGPMEITVVDSGSPDATPEMVAAEFPEVRLIRQENIGFSAANNLAIEEGSSELALLLNPDTEVHEGAIDASVDRMTADTTIGVVGVKLVQPDGSLDHACKRSFPTPLSALAHFSGIGRREGAPGALSQYRATELGNDEPGEVDAVNGAYMLVRREAIENVGMLDEGYWLYMEDLDWCKRFWNAGWKVFYEPQGVALHVKGGSSGRRRGLKQDIAFHRGMGRFYRRHEAPRNPFALNLLVYLGIAIKLASSLLISLLGKLAPNS